MVSCQFLRLSWYRSGNCDENVFVMVHSKIYVLTKLQLVLEGPYGDECISSYNRSTIFQTIS